MLEPCLSVVSQRKMLFKNLFKKVDQNIDKAINASNKSTTTRPKLHHKSIIHLPKSTKRSIGIDLGKRSLPGPPTSVTSLYTILVFWCYVADRGLLFGIMLEKTVGNAPPSAGTVAQKHTKNLPPGKVSFCVRADVNNWFVF